MSAFEIDTRLISVGIDKLNALGLTVQFGDSVFKNEKNISLKEKISNKIKDINIFLEDDTNIIMSLIGGYNSNRLLDYLDYKKIKDSRKIFIGYSDTTALLNSIYTVTGCNSILGPAFINFCNPTIFTEMINSFIDVVINNKKVIYQAPKEYAYGDWFLNNKFRYKNISKHYGWEYIKEGNAKGTLVGGNLETLLILSGTKYFPKVKDSILLLESNPEENILKIERGLIQLAQMNVLKKINGVIFGQMANRFNESLKPAYLDMILTIFEEYDIPILINANFSHVDPIYSLPIGGTIKMDSNTNSIILESNFKV